MFDNKSVIYQKAYQKVRRRFWEKALRRHKSFPTSIVSILMCCNSRRIPAPLKKQEGNCMEPKCVAQLLLGSLLGTHWSAIGYFFPLYLVTVPDVFAKVTRASFPLPKWQMTVQVCNFVNSFILILWSRFSPFRSWRQRAWTGTDFKLAASFIECLLKHWLPWKQSSMKTGGYVSSVAGTGQPRLSGMSLVCCPFFLVCSLMWFKLVT